MMRLRFTCGAFIVSLLFVTGSVRAEEQENLADEKLAMAVKLYSAGDHEASLQLLKGIKEADLSSEDRQLMLQRHLALTHEAIGQKAAARKDVSQAESAMKKGDLAGAQGLLEGVLANKFTPAALRSKAEAMLRDVTARLASQGGRGVSAPPAQVKRLGNSRLLKKLAMEYELLWQQAEKTYDDADGKIRKAILESDFAEAHRLMDYAKQTIELNRRYASPAARYERHRQLALDLEQFIKDEERAHDELVIKSKHEEIARREKDRLDRIRQTKRRQVDQLMEQAGELRKEHRLDDAIEVLKAVLTIDPNNERAAWMKETLEDLSVGERDRRAVEDRHTQAQDLLVINDEVGIPWHDDIRFPKNWLELSAKRRGAAEEAEPEINIQVRQKLRRRAPELRFDAKEFEEVLNQLRALTGLNIHANWTALEAMAIEKDAEVTLDLRDVTYEKALKLILDEVGAGETELAYDIDDGVIQISTKEDLSRRTIIKVYNVQDLLIDVPTFRGRQINIDNVGQNQQQGGLGGGRYVQGTGGGGGGGAGGNLFGGAGGGATDEEQPTDDDPLEPIIELIQETIDPESWREAGGNVGSIQSLHQQLIVTQTSTAHTQLRDLLRDLRRGKALQIGVEARYITISRNWLEQIGVDLDIILNNGNAGFDRTVIVDPNTNNPMLVPRQFTRLGFTPGAPGGVGQTMPTTLFAHPYAQTGLVPATGNVGPASSSMTPIPLVNNTLDLASPRNTNVAGSLGSLVNSTPAFQIFGSFLDNIQVDFLLRATQVDRRSSDLDAPRLVLFNGQRSVFEAFIEQDYVAALTPILGDNAGAFLPQVDTALTGRSLDVQATVSADRRYVTMTIRTFTRVLGDFRTVFFGGSQTVGSGFLELASQTTQQIRTTVSVPDGGTLLVGGLKLSGERDVDAGVPILSRIPILKRAFSNTSNVKDDQVLLILIKPTIIIQEEAEAEAFPTLSAVRRP